MKDGDKDVFEYSLEKKNFPEVGPNWKTYTIQPHAQEKYKMDGLEFVFKMRVSACTDKISSKEDLANFLQDTDTVTYTEEVITAAEKHDYSLVQCCHHKEASSKAVLWLLGRNDCFMHPHVAKPLFLDKGYDLFVLNYSMDGMRRKRGWVEDAWFNSHNYVSNFDIYDEQFLQFSAWSARIWSQFFFDFRSRPLFSVAATMGFTDGVLGVHKKITNGGQKISTLHSNHSS